MEIEGILAALLPSVGAIIGVYVKLTTEMTQLKSKIYVLERDRNELKQLVIECVDGINELKLLLAKKGI